MIVFYRKINKWLLSTKKRKKKKRSIDFFFQRNSCAIVDWFLETKKDNPWQSSQPIKKDIRFFGVFIYLFTFLLFYFFFSLVVQVELLSMKANSGDQFRIGVWSFVFVVHPGHSGTGFGVGLNFKYRGYQFWLANFTLATEAFHTQGRFGDL